MTADYSYTADISNNSYAQFLPWENKNNGYNVTQFYHLSVPDEPNDTRIMGGTQDNGTPYFRFNGNSATPYTDVSSGDGSYSYFGKNFAFISRPNGEVIRLSYDQNNDVRFADPISFIMPKGSANQLFVNPFVVDPNNEDVMYYPSGNVLWRNTQLSQIPDFSQGTSVGWTKLDNHTVPSGYIISAIEVFQKVILITFYITEQAVGKRRPNYTN